MRFLHPLILLAIPIVALAAVAAFLLLARRQRRLSLLANNSVLRAAGFGAAGAETLARVQLALLAAGLALLAIAAARPQWGRSDYNVASRGASLLVALDVSRSMLATDVRPNRLERAKVDILDLISDLKGDRCGLLVFRGKGNMLCPLTADYAFLRQAVDGVSVDSAPRGETDIADALEKALEALETSAEDNCAIVLISDGEDLAGRARKAAAKAAARNIPIFAVGIGDPAGAEVPAADGGGAMKFGGKAVRSRLTEDTLREIASATGGAYIPLATSGTASTTLGAIYRQHLSKMAKREYDEMLENRFVERYQLFLIPALALIFAAAALSRGRLAGPRRRRDSARRPPAGAAAATAALVAGAAIVMPPPAACAEQAMTPHDARATYNQAVELYRAGDYTNAASALGALSIRHDMPEAVELFGAAEFAQSEDQTIATNAAERLKLLGSAASSFQLALATGAQERDRTARNLARAAEAIPALREEVRQGEIQAKYGNAQPPALIAQMMETQRGISAKAREAAAIADAAGRIEAFEELALRQREIQDKNTIVAKMLGQALEGVTNEEARANCQMLIDDTAKTIGNALDALENIDPDAVQESDRSGVLLLETWKPMAEPPQYVYEAILCETNTVDKPGEPRWRLVKDSEVALDTMRLFSQTFPNWAEEFIKNDEQQRAQSGSTNAPAFTKEDAAKIMELLEPLMFILEDSAKFDDDDAKRVAAAREALVPLEQIRDLLPKPPQQQQQDQQQQQNQQDQQQDQQQQDQQQQDQQQQDQQEDQRQDEEKQEQQEKPLPEEVEEALRRALQREREHEAEKQKMRREAPLPPNSRDW